MFLLDTSAWIESFKKNSKFRIEEKFDPGLIYLCLPVYQEFLQGIKDDRTYSHLKKALDHSNFLEEPMTKVIFEEASNIFRQAKKKGITIRSSMDCQIAAIAIQHQAIVVHKDRDYKQISKFTNLKEVSI